MNRADMLNALRQVAMMMPGEGALWPLFGFLAGRIDQVHFVSDLEGAGVGIRLSGHAQVWPRIPFRAQMDQKDIGHPLAFISEAAMRDDEIYVKVDLPPGELPAWYEAVSEGSVQDPRERLEASMAHVREQIDLALDAYRTATEEIDHSGEGHREYLQFVLRKAKSEMRELNARLVAMEIELGKVEP